MKTVRLAALLALSLILVAFSASQGEEQPADLAPVSTAPRTVFLLRHAETAEASGDRPLDDRGKRRAGELARLLSASGVTHVFSSSYARTKQTVAPLAEALRLDVVVYDARSTDEIVGLLDALEPGAVAVVAGHSNTTPQLARELGVDGLPELVEHPPYGEIFREDAYDRLLVVTLPPNTLAGTAIELRYGAGPPAADVAEALRR